jgi:hypothetical protein
MTFLFTGAVTVSYMNLQTGKTITVPENGPGKFFGHPVRTPTRTTHPERPA